MKNPWWLYTVEFLLVVGIFLADLTMPLGVASGVPYVAVVLIAMYTPRRHDALVAATTCTLLLVLGFFLSPAGSPLWQSTANRGLALFAIWLTALLCLDRKRLEEQLRDGVRRVTDTVNKLKCEVAERQLAEGALRESEEKYRALVEHANEPICIAQDAVVCFANAKFQAVLDYKTDELLTMPFTQLIDPEDRQMVVDRHQRRMRGEEVPHQYPLRLIDRHGTTIWVEINAVRVEWQGKPATVCCFRDIREQKKAEEAQARLAAIVASSNDAIIGKTLDGHIVSWNAGAETMYGYLADEVIGQPVSMLVPHDRQDEIPDILARIKRGEHIDHFETVWMTKAGQQIDVSLTVSPIRDVEHKVIGASVIARDVTERKQSELERLRRYTTELERSNRDLHDFAYVASHDLQEPLRMLVAFSGLLQEDIPQELSPDAQRDLNYIREAATRMQLLLQDLLDYSRAGRSPMQKIPIAIDACLDRALEQLAEKIEAVGATVHRQPLPKAIGDNALLTQLFTHILDNAIKFVGDQPPELHVSAVADDSTCTLSIRDNGLGIQSDFTEKIFAPFQRLHPRGEYDGTGIGLAICRKIVERHGGRIWVESEPGRGSDFKVSLPSVDEPVAGGEFPTDRDSRQDRSELQVPAPAARQPD